MFQLYHGILEELNNSLNFLENHSENAISKAEEGIKITKNKIEEIKKLVLQNGFQTKEEEIDFFKNIKPLILSKLIYYIKLFNIEGRRPKSSNKSQIKYLNTYIDRLQNYITDNLEFYHYYTRGATFLDEHYFIRGRADLRLPLDTFHFFLDEQFSTSHDNNAAIIVAYDMMIKQLKKEVSKLENISSVEISPKNQESQPKLFWRASKTDLVELVYALHGSKALNAGEADIKVIASTFELMFNIDLGDYYRTYLEIKARKIHPTKFLDKLKDNLVVKIEESNI